MLAYHSPRMRDLIKPSNSYQEMQKETQTIFFSKPNISLVTLKIKNSSNYYSAIYRVLLDW